MARLTPRPRASLFGSTLVAPVLGGAALALLPGCPGPVVTPMPPMPADVGSSDAGVDAFIAPMPGDAGADVPSPMPRDVGVDAPAPPPMPADAGTDVGIIAPMPPPAPPPK